MQPGGRRAQRFAGAPRGVVRGGAGSGTGTDRLTVSFVSPTPLVVMMYSTVSENKPLRAGLLAYCKDVCRAPEVSVAEASNVPL